MRRLLVIAGIVSLFATQAIVRFQSDINHDTAWYLYVAEGLLHGKHLYTDFLEVNPPLGIWLTVPVVWFANLAGLSSIAVNYGLLLALTALSLVLANRYLRQMGGVPDAVRAILCLFIAAALLFLPAADFTEREHLMVLLFLPWPFLRLARSRGAGINVLEAGMVGLLAAIAICIKPQSVFAPLGAELVLLLRYRNFRGPIVPENLAAAAFALLYGIAIVVFVPEFFRTIVSLGVKAYVPLYGYSDAAIWIASLRSFGLVALAAFLWRRTEEPLADITALLAAISAGFILSYLIQYKGFSYQILPARVFASLACVAAVSSIVTRLPFVAWLSTTRFLVGASLLLAAIDFTYLSQTYPNNGKYFDAAIARYAPGSRSFFIASTQVSHGFPFALNRKLVWASRLPTQWLAPYVASKWQEGPLPKDEIIARTLDWTVTDLVTFHPDIVFINESKEQLYLPDGQFDYVKFWSHDPRFAPFWASYERRDTKFGFAIYTAR